MKFWPVLEQGFSLANHRLRLVLLDLIWKGLWFGATSALAGAAGFWLLTRIPGPELATPDAILLMMGLRDIWSGYSRMVFLTLGVLVVIGMALRIVLESWFRGGTRQFWVFAASHAARIAILAALAAVLGLFLFQDRTAGMVFISLVVLVGIWFMLTIAETLIRQDAVEVLGTDPILTVQAIGLFLVVELGSAALLCGISAAALLLAGRLWELVLAVGLSMTLAVLWSILQSYLFVVRSSTVDIMRRNVDGI